ncbi:E3 ubiquitin/ISG15 ligase TRIM25-like, partial [Ruditapes philippinarum]|uniref:E3 ubiquitin/ISG15 ligase TRIM25-like n=1 Tax=Ruditapes philippinarum TaxID=129788 RepID=UPI00295B867E
MATGKDIKSSVVVSSEEIFDTNCSPCSESGKLIEAVKFCVDCGSYFCSKCLQDHNKFPALRSHQILDKSDKIKSDGNIETGPGLPTERCAVHHGKLVDMFCKDHDEVCCAACIAIKHRSCINVDYLPDVAKGINNSAEYEKTKSSLENVLIELRGVIEAKTDNLKILQNDKEQLFEEIENLKAEILMKVEELVETSKQQVSLKYREVKKHIQSDLDTLNTILTTTTTDFRKLSEKNESQLFVNLKASKVSIRDCETFLSELSTGNVNEKLELVANNSLKDQLNDIESLVVDTD